MIEIHIYGHLKTKFDENARLSENTTITILSDKEENFLGLLKRLDLSTEDIGDCFLNHKIITDEKTTFIPDRSRVAIFSRGMRLIDGGQYIKNYPQQ
jgi:hypothetical protein